MIIAMAASALIYAGVTSSRAISAEANKVSSQIEEYRRHLRNSYSFGEGKEPGFNELYSVSEECKSKNWDGQGAAPVREETYRLAYRFLEAIPLGVSRPSVGAEPDGHLTFEWYVSPRRTLSVSVSPEGDLHYSALLNTRKRYGTEPFFDGVPKVILDLAAEVMALK
jgi:hypothetical protein